MRIVGIDKENKVVFVTDGYGDVVKYLKMGYKVIKVDKVKVL